MTIRVEDPTANPAAFGAMRSALGVAAAPVPLFAALGDSITEYNTSGGYYQARGYLTQARALLKNRFDFPVANNFGISGQTTTQMLARIADVIAARPYGCAVMAGINDPRVQVPIAKETTKANLYAIYDALIAAGIVVVACPIMPCADWGAYLSGAGITSARQGVYWVNRMIRQYALTARRGTFYVADTDTATMDWANSLGNPLTTPPMTTDSIHPSNIGGETAGGALAAILDPMLPALQLIPRSQALIYDATTNPLGNRLASLGYQVGTAGTAGTGTSGSVTTGMTLARSVGSTLTAVASKRTRATVNGVPNAGEIQDIVLGGGTGGATTEQIVYTRDLAAGASTFAIGDTLVLDAEIDVSGLTNVQNVAVFLQDISGSGSPFKWGLQTTGAASDRVRPTSSKVISTPPLLMTGVTARLRVVIDAACDDAGVSGTVSIGGLNLRTARATD